MHEASGGEPSAAPRVRGARVALAVAVVVFLAQRALVVSHPLGWLDSDDAVVGLMASDVALGRGYVPYPVPGEGAPATQPGWPLYFYGQPYHGAATALVAGGAGRGAVVSPGLLAAVVAVEAAALLAALHVLVARSAGARAASVATLLFVLGPPYLLERTVRPAGNYVEVLLLATAMLLWRGAPLRFGLAAGAALWSNPLAWLVAPAGLGLVRDGRKLARACAGFVIGALPVLVECLRSGPHPLAWLVGRSGPVVENVPTVAVAARRLVAGFVPVLTGAAAAVDERLVPRWASIALVAAVALGLGALVVTAASRSAPRERRAVAAALAGAVLLTVALALGTRFRSVLSEPRYYVLVLLAVPVGLAWVLERVPAACRWGAVGLLAGLGAWTQALVVAERTAAHDRLEAQIDVLAAHGVRHAASDYGIAYRLTFGSEERIVAAPLLFEGGRRHPRIEREVAARGECAAAVVKRASERSHRLRREVGGRSHRLVRVVYDAWIPIARACRAPPVP